jgi:hypothetical protein
MRWAKEELANGDRAKALWNIDMALSLSPRMEEAIRLKERLTEKAYWADESRISSAKYLIQQMIMQELGKPVERIVPPDKPRDADKVESDVRKALGISKRYEDPIPGMGTGLVGVQTTTRPAGADTHSPAPDKPAAPTKKPTTRPTTRPDQAKTNVVEPKTTQ